jgi:Protein of unknown function (DUF3551)
MRLYGRRPSTSHFGARFPPWSAARSSRSWSHRCPNARTQINTLEPGSRVSNCTSTRACALQIEWRKTGMKMKSGMQRGLFFSAALLVLGGVFDCATSASAQSYSQSYSVCLNGGSDNSIRCGFSSMEQCRATASGGLGYCEQNPFAANAGVTDTRGRRLSSYRQSGPTHHG